MDNPNHNEAWSLAHMKKDESNLARAYIELRQLALFMWKGPITDAGRAFLSA